MSYFDDNEDFITGEVMLRQIERSHIMADASKQATKVVTGEVRLSFVHALEPYAFDGEDPRYSVMILIPKKDKQLLERIKRAVDAAVQQGVTSKWGGKKPKKLRMPLRDGDEEMDGEEFQGMYFMRVASKTKPGVIDAYKNPVEDSNGIYSGCYGRVSMNFFPYNTAGNNGVSAGLNNIQVLRDGEPLGGRSRAEDDFDDDFAERYIEEDDDYDELLS